MRIHIIVASGSGTTTLGQALAAERNALHLDSDNYYWLSTIPPFKEKRESSERHAKLKADLYSTSNVILSGSIVGWGQDVEDCFDLIVFLYVPVEIRINRIRERELRHYGAVNLAFLKWAQEYDEGPSEGRSFPPRQNSCRLHRPTQGAAMKDGLGSIRTGIQGQSGGEVAAAGERGA